MKSERTQKQYLEIHFPVAGIDRDLFSGILFRNGCLGVVELSDDEWQAFFPGDWSSEHVQYLKQEVMKSIPNFPWNEVQLEKNPEQDWNAGWKKYFVPIEVTKDIWVRPPWEKLPPQATGIELIIDPQMAFGTGHHETTRLMIQAMQQMTLKDASVLDLGCGSGILSLLAKKLGAREVVGVDIDPDAIANALHNQELNQVSGIEFLVGDISTVQNRTFSVILANIHLEVLMDLALNFSSMLMQEGKLLVSGILKEDVNLLSYLYKHAGLVMEERLFLKEWAALLFTLWTDR
ncbi:MAG: 50S ribosomal protein L11 methyltransferase [Calditrichaeota bacterium]|nr:MAG: 50S ribosomal protein L11 methyltransferase [Calditrichota bacterium]